MIPSDASSRTIQTAVLASVPPRRLPFPRIGDLKDEHRKVGRAEIGQKSRCLFT
uniref:Uncharacterized protein n=1 Tax=Arundo donax TaxID=35708 RepID=A0A0A9FQH5_ARUDO